MGAGEAKEFIFVNVKKQETNSTQFFIIIIIITIINIGIDVIMSMVNTIAVWATINNCFGFDRLFFQSRSVSNG